MGEWREKGKERDREIRRKWKRREKVINEMERKMR